MAEVPENLRPTHREKAMHAMKAERAVKQITFNPSEASPGNTLYVYVPKLNENEVLVPGSPALVFDIDLAGGHPNNFLVQNVTRALVDRLLVSFAGRTLQDTVGYDIYKTFEDLFISQEERDNRILEEIQSEDLCKIRSEVADMKTSGVDAEEKVTEVYGKKYRIRLDHQILTDDGVFYPQALYNDLKFDVKLAQAIHVVKGSDTTKLKYKLKNIQLEYKMIRRKTLADEAQSVYTSGKELLYDQVMHDKEVAFKKDVDSRLTIKVNAQRRSERFRKIHLPRSDESQRHGQRLAHHALQQRHQRQRHVGRGPQPVCERKK